MTTPTPDRPPLWRVMHDAFLSSTLSGEDGRLGFAQEIRALRDWLVPEEETPTDQALVRDWIMRMRLRDRLSTETDRAEQGDG